MQPTITICSDAGHKNFHKKGIGAWACYIRTPSRTIKQSGIIKQSVKGSSHAEQYAIANALFILNKVEDISKYRLIIYCDNKHALKTNFITRTPKSGLYAKQKATQDWFDEFVKPYLEKAGSYEMRHVKGHLDRASWDVRSARNFMNDWCDTEVKRLMRLGIKARWEEVKREREEADQTGL